MKTVRGTRPTGPSLISVLGRFSRWKLTIPEYLKWRGERRPPPPVCGRFEIERSGFGYHQVNWKVTSPPHVPAKYLVESDGDKQRRDRQIRQWIIMRPSRFLAGLPAAPGAGAVEADRWRSGAEGSPASSFPTQLLSPFHLWLLAADASTNFASILSATLPNPDRSHVIITSNYFIGTKRFFVERRIFFFSLPIRIGFHFN